MLIYKKAYSIALVSLLSASIFGCGDNDSKETSYNKKEIIKLLNDPDVAMEIYNTSKEIEKKKLDEKYNDDMKAENLYLEKYGSIMAESLSSALVDMIKESDKRELVREAGITQKPEMPPSINSVKIKTEQEIAYKVAEKKIQDGILKNNDNTEAVFGSSYKEKDFVLNKFESEASETGMSDDEILVTKMTISYILNTGNRNVDKTQRETLEHLIKNNNYRLALSILDVYAKTSFFLNKNFKMSNESSEKFSKWLKDNSVSACYTFSYSCPALANSIGDYHVGKGEYADAYYFYGLATIKSKRIGELYSNGYGEKVYSLLGYLGCTQERDVWGDFVVYRDGKVVMSNEPLLKGVPYPSVNYKKDINVYKERIELARYGDVPKLSNECLKQISF